MCNLSEALVELGIEQGVKRGIEQGIEQGKELGREERNISMAQMMIQEREPIEKIEKYPNFSNKIGVKNTSGFVKKQQKK